MKIGIYCTNNLAYPLPSGQIYANMEVAANQAEALTALGHDVTFFAPEGTKTTAKLESFGMLPFSDPTVYKRYPHPGSSYQYENIMLVKALNLAQDQHFDIFQSHTRPLSIVSPAALKVSLPVVITVHDPLTDSAFAILSEFNQFTNLHFISISNAQRATCPGLSWQETIYHGLDLSKYPFTKSSGDYLLYSGRIMPEKGVDTAVQVALKSKLPLIICGTIYPEHQAFFDKTIAPFLSDQITYAGALTKAELIKKYAQAKATLMPVRWSEPFGLVAIESLACGTPVIALKQGALPEIVKNGQTGFLAEDEDGLIDAVAKASSLFRQDCRDDVVSRFSNEIMAKNYVDFYQTLL